MAVVTCIVWIVDEPACRKCGTILGHNVVVSASGPPPELLCRKCRRPCRIGPDGVGVPLAYFGRRTVQAVTG
jgi:hypothetical protein